MSETVRAVAVGERSATINGSTRARHVAIVSDGSARWADARGLSIREGHEAAADTVIARIADAIELGIGQLTLYAFSTENWARPQLEVTALVTMLTRRIDADMPALAEQGVRVRFIGRRDRAGAQLTRAMADAEALSVSNTGLEVFVAFDYGGRDEIVRAAERYRGGGEAEFARLLAGNGMRDPDLVIRTSGEQRLSNFLLWQAAYSELVFCRELWPDFDRGALEQCLAEYSDRRRRFGARCTAHEKDATGAPVPSSGVAQAGGAIRAANAPGRVRQGG
jgi:undecaprenyl diphosphate synthase